MIYHSMDDEEPSKELIGTQKKNLSYTYLHWEHMTVSKYKLHNYGQSLSYHQYKPIGPTMLVEWNKE